jgi:AraC-like DNA-binding protein
MKVFRDPRLVSGYVYEHPAADLPELTHCGEALCATGHHLAPHVHSGFEFMLISRGEAQWSAAGQTVTQRPGDLYIAYPDEPHGTGGRRNAENQQVWIGVELDGWGRSGRELADRLRQEHPVLLAGCENLEPALRGIVRQVVSPRPRRSQVITIWIHTLIELLQQRLDQEAVSPADAGAWLPLSPGVQRAVSYLERNLERRVPLADLAAVATARSVPQFCARFKREVGVSPAAHHLRARLEAARTALRQPSFDILTTALHFGFSSSQHFSTQFRRAFGVTPGEWQRAGR